MPIGVTDTSAHLPEIASDNELIEHGLEPSWLPANKPIRVALYNETNTTTPSYTTGNLNDEYTSVFDVFDNAGYDVTRLTFQNILNHELTTANYDVLVLADNLPRENITHLVREYWLGGGGILSFDSSAGYLGYAGILPRETHGVDDGLNTYWRYFDLDMANITNRHPVTKSYAIGEQLTVSYADWALYNWSTLMDTSIAADLTRLAIEESSEDLTQAIAMDPTDKGGKVVHLGIPVGAWPVDWENMMIDATEWLCPRPKGRILFDVSHDNYYPVDTWDPTGWTNSPRFAPLRNTLVNRTYTFDKLWPSASGNFTPANLEPYDMLILNAPEYNFTSSEVTALSAWISEGGSLLAMGDHTFFADENQNINYLMSSYNLEIASGYPYSPSSFATTEIAEHPTAENIGEVYFSGGLYVNYTETAYSLIDNGPNTVIAAQEVGAGRIVLASDINFFANVIKESDNTQYAVNLVNWLVSWNGEALVYQSASAHFGESNYRSSLSLALNELGVDYMLHLDAAYFNLSLNSKEWDMVIVDANYISPAEDYEWILNHLEGGGKLIMRDFMFYQLDGYSGYDMSLFSYVGFAGTGNRITAGPPIVYPWETNHPVFNQPLDYGANNISSGDNYLNTDYTNVTLFDNATALAGTSPTDAENASAVILGADGRALCNMFAVAEYTEDTDDSTYADNYELWLNEIAFMMRPRIDGPNDMDIEVLSRNETIVWNVTSDRPLSYEIERNSVQVEGGTWDGAPITLDLEEDNLGLVTFDLTVNDTAGYSASDTVMVNVVDTTGPNLMESPDNLEYEEGTVEHLVNWSFTEDFPDAYVFYMNDTVEGSGDWDGSEISIDVGGSSPGVWNLTLTVNDTSGNLASSSVYLTVTKPAATTTTTTETTTTTSEATTTTTSPPDAGPFGLPDQIAGIDTWIILAAAGAVVVIIILVLMKKR